QQIEQRTDAGRRISPHRRQLRPYPFGEPALDRFQYLVAELPFRDTLAETAGAAQRLDGLREAGGAFEHRLVSHDATARQVALPGCGLSPGRQFTQNTEELGIDTAAQPEATPRFLWVAAIHLRIGQFGHLLGEPTCPAVRDKPLLQHLVDSSEMDYIGEGIADLALRQGPAQPVGES